MPELNFDSLSLHVLFGITHFVADVAI